MAQRRFKDNCPNCTQEVRVTWAGEKEELALISVIKFFCVPCRRRWYRGAAVVEFPAPAPYVPAPYTPAPFAAVCHSGKCAA
jgi:hypothetical protein